MRKAKGCVCAAAIPRLTGSLQVRERKKLWRESASAFSSSGMLIWVCAQPSYQFGMEFVSGYLSLELFTYCWTRLKQASGFSSYFCLLPDFQRAGAPGTHSLSLGFPEALLSDPRGGSEVSRLLWNQSGEAPVAWCHLGSGILQDTDDGEGLCSSQGTCGCLGWPFPTCPNPPAAVKCKQRGKDVSKICSVNLISARLKNSWSEETCLLWGLGKQFLCKLLFFFFLPSNGVDTQLGIITLRIQIHSMFFNKHKTNFSREH